MIVVPTEKQFDWLHAPVVLFLIVLLNVLIFFIYQSGDAEKYLEAVHAYDRSGFIEQEWPLLKTYLKSKGETDTLIELTKDYESGNNHDHLSKVLLRQDFYQHLTQIARDSFDHELYTRWQHERKAIQEKFNSLSPIAHGLTASTFKLSSLLSHQFLHGDVMHLLGNMFFLVICGFAVEAAIGHWRFLVFYLVGGFAAGMAQVVSNWDSSVPLVGASGAISAVMAMYLAVFRFRNIEFFYWIFFFVGYFRAPALLILPFYIGKELYSYYTDPESNVAFLAHAGGFVGGCFLIAVSLLVDRKTINKEYIENDQSPIDEQQQRMAEIYRALEKYSFAHAYKLANEAIKEFGETFDLAVIRFNLLKISKGKNYPQSVLRLWQMKRLLPHEIERLEKIWFDHPKLHDQLDDESAIRLGMQFSSLEHPIAAEQIIDMLAKRACKNPSFIIFAQKLSGAFASLGQKQKQTQYEALANQLAQGGQHGAL